MEIHTETTTTHKISVHHEDKMWGIAVEITATGRGTPDPMLSEKNFIAGYIFNRREFELEPAGPYPTMALADLVKILPKNNPVHR